MTSTHIRVTRETAEKLKRLRGVFSVNSSEAVITELLARLRYDPAFFERLDKMKVTK